MRREVMSVLGRLAFGADLLEQPQAGAYARAAQSIRTLRGDLGEIAERGELTNIRGVGPATAQIIEDVLAGEKPAPLAELEAQLPAGLWDIRKIRGLGPKKVRALWHDLGATTLAELEYACTENRLISLKGFGAKTQTKVLAEIERIRATQGLRRLDQALATAAGALESLSTAVDRAEIVGEVRRGREVVNQIDILYVPSTAEPVALPEGVEVVLHATTAARFAVEQVLRTGSEGHVERLRRRAAARGVDLDALEAPDEAAVYAALGLLLPAPERREDDSPLVEIGKARPRLVRREDLRGALHNHTVASDGRNTLREMRDAAAALGLTYLGVSDHSVSAFYARGLEASALAKQAREIAALNASDGGCALLTGVESDILADGSLDYEGHVLAQLEVVVASVHSRHGQDREAMTARMLAAARNPFTHVIGHPTGRLLLGRAPSDYDVEALIEVCAETGCALELNSSPARLDLDENYLAIAKARGVPVSIAADAHSVEGLKVLEYGVTIARRAGLTPDDVLNCRPLPALRAWLDSSVRPRVGHPDDLPV